MVGQVVENTRIDAERPGLRTGLRQLQGKAADLVEVGEIEGRMVPEVAPGGVNAGEPAFKFSLPVFAVHDEKRLFKRRSRKHDR